MKIVSIKWLPYLFIIVWFQLMDSLSAGADLRFKSFLIRLIQKASNHKDQFRLARIIESLRAKYALKDFDDCYEPRYRNQNLHLFHGNFSLEKIIEDFYIEEKERVLKLSLTSWRQKIKTLLENVESIIKEVERCLSSPIDKRTKVGFTSLTDWTDYEFRRLSGFKRPCNATQNYTILLTESLSDAEYAEIPEAFDWRNKGYVGSIKNQRTCGACFIFSAVACVETAYMIQKKITYDKCQINLSEQAILNCMTNPHTCADGGFPSMAWRVMNRSCIFDQKTRPYLNHQNKSDCQRAPSNKWGIKIYDFIENDENLVGDKRLQQLVMKYGAISVAIDSRKMKFLRGPFNLDCEHIELDHSITLIGWDKNYWIIKNSWGNHWGIDGYLYLKRGGDRCGILEYQGFVFLEHPKQ